MPEMSQELQTPGMQTSGVARDDTTARRAHIERGSVNARAESVRTRNISNAERGVSAAVGVVLALYGLTRRSWFGVALATLGAVLTYRGATGHSYVYQRIGVERSDAPIEIAQALTIKRPIEEVYGFWRKLENLPRFMKHLKSVQQTSDKRSHWIAQAFGNRPALEWDSEITEERTNELLRWQSLADSPIRHRGEVRFRQAPGHRGTEVHVHINYQPPVGTAIAAIMYPVSKQMLKEDIRRFKQVLEAGEIPTTEGQPSGRVRAQPSVVPPSSSSTVPPAATSMKSTASRSSKSHPGEGVEF